MKIRKKISEVFVLSGEAAIPLPNLLDKYVAKAMDEVEIVLSDEELCSIYEAKENMTP